VGYGPKGQKALSVTKLRTTKDFDPEQPRDDNGQWTSDGSDGGSEDDALFTPKIGDDSEKPQDTAGKKPIETSPVQPKQPLKETIPGQSGKAAADDVPSWAKGKAPLVGESSDTFARRLLKENYPGKLNFETGASSEYSQIKKWGDRNFRDPRK
jgi:hypothetical protein